MNHKSKNLQSFKSYFSVAIFIPFIMLLAACDNKDNTTDVNVILNLQNVPANASTVLMTFDGGDEKSLKPNKNSSNPWQATLDKLQPRTTHTVTLKAIAGDSISPQTTHNIDIGNEDAVIDLPFIKTNEDPACKLAALTPSKIQGTGATSPEVDNTVTVKGVVTGDFQGAKELSGLFIRDLLGDGDAASSDGLFVAATQDLKDVAVGDLIVATGKVSENKELTQLADVENIIVCSSSLAISPTTISLPTQLNTDRLEPFEGMLINFTQPLTVTQNYFQGRYGQLTLSANGRLYNPSNGNELGENTSDNQRRLIFLDDGQDVDDRGDNPNPVPYLSAGNTLRVGDQVNELTGILSYGQVGSSQKVLDYRLHPTKTPTFTRVNQRKDTPDDVNGDIKVASFNVLNYFTTFKSKNKNARGAYNAKEFNRQKDKIVAAISAIDADIVGLIEIENNGGAGDSATDSATTSAIADLLQALNAKVGAETYAGFAAPANLGNDAIKQAFIYKPSKVTPVGDAIVSTNTAFTVNTYSRRPVARSFKENSSDETFTIIVNHFKSKGCRNASGADTDQDDGQGCYNGARTKQAEALITMVDGLSKGSTNNNILIIGDLNAYGNEDPIKKLEQASFVDLVARDVPAEERYSYVFSPGQAGYLDHALASSSLAPHVTGTTIWHINADEPNFLGYGTPPYKPKDVQNLYTPTPFRSSDHDPVIIGLSFGQ